MSTKGKILAGTVVLGLSVAGQQTLKNMEGKHNSVYADLGGVSTACWGTTRFDNTKLRFTNEECQRYFDRDIRAVGTQVQRHLKVQVSQEEFDALVIFTYNVGEGAYMRSQLLRYLNAGKCLDAGAEFPRWAYVRSKNGKVLVRGLLNRRFAEQDIFTQGCFKRLGG